MVDALPVMFRVSDETVTAVFPTLPADASGMLTCYAHVGQHGACSQDWLRTTRPAAPDEYRDLLRELDGLGYHVRVVSRQTNAMRHIFNRLMARTSETARSVSQGRERWHGQYQLQPGGMWFWVRNQAGGVISYASGHAALEAARWMRERELEKQA